MGLDISPEFGYVILAASGSFLVNMWQMSKIGGKRKELGIQVSSLPHWVTWLPKNFSKDVLDESYPEFCGDHSLF